MNVIVSKIALYGLPVLITVVSGFVISNLEKPLSSPLFTVHKLVAIGTAILIGRGVYLLFKAGDLSALALIVFAITGLLFVALIVSGSLLSLVAGTEVTLSAATLQIAQQIHQIVPLLVLAASALSIYVLASHQA